MAKFNKYRRKTKYWKFQFKLTDQQYNSLEAYCDVHDITAVKAIKQIVLNYLAESKDAIPKQTKAKNVKTSEILKVSKKQLNLFDLIEAERTTAKSSS